MDTATLGRMTRSLGHRGPDFEGYHIGSFLGLGHTRLSIIDLSPAGNQPMATDDKKIWIAHNGEIYNYKDIREELSQKGYSFRSHTDTEVVLKSYQQWGPKCVEKFNGMFAFAIWDEREQTLFLARDRLGEKPLYYWMSGKTFAFASEIKALLQLEAIGREIDFQSFSNYLSLRYVPGPKTIFKNILKLPPAHYMVIRDSNVKITRYWDFEFDIDPARSEQEWEEQFYELLKDSVNRRLMSDVPLGVYLSGGVDSTVITGLMSQLGRKSITTFSIGFEAELDERPSARRVSDHFGTSHNEFLVRSEDFARLPEITWYLDEPFGDIIILPAFLLSFFSKESVKVVLTGEGGDELLGGYVHQKALARFHNVKRFLPSQCRRLLAAFIRLFPTKFLDFWFDYPASMGPKGKERLANLLEDADDNAQNYLSLVSAFNSREKSELLAPALRKRVTDSDTQEWMVRLKSNMNMHDRHIFNRLIRQEFDSWLPDNILFKQDRLTMGNSIEGRVPFLDHRIVEFCARLPIRLKNRGTNKYLLRQMAGHRILKPDSNVKRPFFMPLTGVFETPYQHLIDTYLSRERVKSSGWWDGDFVRELVAKRRRSPLLYDKQIMVLILWEIWAEVFGMEAPT